MIMQLLKTSAIALVISSAMLSSAHAATVLTFDGVASGTAANLAVPAGYSFFNAAYLPDQDEYGDDIPGSEKWKVDPSVSDAVIVLNPLTVDYGVAPSPNNALDARWSPILMQFDTAKDLTGFSVTLDNSTYGNLWADNIYFLDANKNLIGSLVIQGSIPGYVANLNTPLFGVKEVVFASGALYDNITVSEVPVPAAAWLMGSALLGLGGVARRRSQR